MQLKLEVIGPNQELVDDPPSCLSSFSGIPISAVEEAINYRFQNKALVEEALTHSSCLEFTSYERLEFVGDAALGLAFSNHVFLAYPTLEPGQLSLLRAANISTEKLARVAVKLGLHNFLRHFTPALQDRVREFAAIVSQEDNPVAYGGTVKAPKVLADIVESIAGAVYIDVAFDLNKFWVIFRGLMEPVVTAADLRQQPQPITKLFELCQKQGKEVEIKRHMEGMMNVASVYVDDTFISSASFENGDIARLYAAKEALFKLSQSHALSLSVDALEEEIGIKGAMQKLHEICTKRRWQKPRYSDVESTGPPHNRRFVSSVRIGTHNMVLHMQGEEKPKRRESQNSAASLMIHALQKSGFLDFLVF